MTRAARTTTVRLLIVGMVLLAAVAVLALAVGAVPLTPSTAWHALLGDGSVRFISDNTDFTVVRNLCSRDDGIPVGDF